MDKKGIPCILLLALALVIPLVNGWEIDLTSTATLIHDGDSFHIIDDEVRLADIDAPEWYNPGGTEATDALTNLISGETLYIDTDQKGGRDDYLRLVAVVYVEYNSTHYLNVNKRLLILDVVDLWDFSDNEFDPATWTEYVPKTQKYFLTIITPQGSGVTNPPIGKWDYKAGTIVPMTATPNTNYIFDHWIIDGANGGTSSSISITMNQAHQVQAVFRLISSPPPTTYTLQIQPPEGEGTTSPSQNTYSYEAGTSITITATTTEDWRFSHWILDGSNSGTTPSKVILMNTDHIVLAVFTQETQPPPNPTPVFYSCQIEAQGSGTTNPAPGTYIYTKNAEFSVQAMPDTGWHFEQWYLDGISVGIANPFTVAMNTDHRLKAVFTQNNPPSTLIVVDDSEISDSRCDINSVQTVRIHFSWDNGTSVSSGTATVGEHNIYGYNSLFKRLEVGSDGWVSFQVENPSHNEKTWDVSEVNCTGVTVFSMNIQPPRIIWDFVNVTLSIIDGRIDVNSKPEVNWSATYAYDNSPFDGEVVLKIINSQASMPTLVGKASYYVESVTDNVYNLTATKSNSVDCVWDRVKIVQGGVASPRSKTGEVVGVWFKAVYEYDLEEFTGDVNADGGINKIFLNGVPMVWFSTDRIWRYDAKSDFGGNFTYIITGVEDTRYKLSTYVDAAGPRFIIWEKPFFETPLGVLSIMLFIAATILVAAFFFLNKSTSNMAGKPGERPSPTLVVDKEPTLNDFKDPEDVEKKQVTEIRGSANVVPIVSKAAPKNPGASPYWSFQEVKKKPVRDAPKVAHVRASSEVPALYQGKLERSRAYEPWSKEEDAELIKECEAGKTILEIALAHQRNEGGIRSRINKLYEYR